MIIFLKFLLPLIISIVLLYISENYVITVGGKKINKFITMIALIIPMIVSASRLIIDVGDSKQYGEFVFNYAAENSWTDYYKYFHNNYYSFESGFLFLTFIVSRITLNYHILFFIFSMINVLLIYDGIKRLSPYINMSKWFGMLVFYLLFFGETLNIVRQCLGIAIIFWGLHYIFEKKPIKYLITVFVAMLFHISSALGVLLYLLYYLINNSKNKKLLVFSISLASLAFVMFYSKIFLILQGFNILPSKFFSLYYIDGIPFSPFALLTKGPLLLFVLFSKNSEQKLNDGDYWYYFLLLTFDLIVSQLAGGNEYLYRMALVFAYIKIPFFASSTNKKNRLLLMIYCVVYFYMEYVYQGALPPQMFK